MIVQNTGKPIHHTTGFKIVNPLLNQITSDISAYQKHVIL